MPESHAYERLQNGIGDRYDIAQEIRRLHAAGVSFPAIARLLHRESGVKVSYMTVARWVRRWEAA